MTILAGTVLGVTLTLTIQAIYRRMVEAFDRTLRDALG